MKQMAFASISIEDPNYARDGFMKDKTLKLQNINILETNAFNRLLVHSIVIGSKENTNYDFNAWGEAFRLTCADNLGNPRAYPDITWYRMGKNITQEEFLAKIGLPSSTISTIDE